MKNLIKKYFIFMSYSPSMFFIVIATFFLFIFMIIGFIAGFERSGTILSTYYLWILGILFINMCLAYFIKYKYITNFDCSYNTMFQVLITKNGDKIISKGHGSIWEKGKVYYINHKNYLYSNLSKADGETEINRYLKGEGQTSSIVRGKYKNSLIEVPVTISLHYDGFIDLPNLFEVLINTQASSLVDDDHITVTVDEYLKMVFQKTNEKNQKKFDEIVKRYTTMEISDAQFLNELTDVVEFPERLFPCIIDTKICLGAPEISACKGMMC